MLGLVGQVGIPFDQRRDIAPTLLRQIAKEIGLTIDEFFKHR